MNDLDALCALALANDMKVGIIAGYSINKIQTSADFIDATLSVQNFNYSRTGKLNFMMLEHEIWAPLAKDEFNNFVMTTLAGKNVGQNPYNNNVNTFYDQLVLDHYNLLDEMNVQKANSANFWSVVDYLAYPFNTANGATKGISNSAHRLTYTQTIVSKSDKILLVYYQNHIYRQGTDWLIGAADWRERLKAFGSQAYSEHIPLFSAEYTGGTCYPFSPTTSTQDFLGKYLGLSSTNPPDTTKGQNFHTAEIEYRNQMDNLATQLGSNLALAGFAYYGYQCFKELKYGLQYNSQTTCLLNESESDKITIFENVKVFPNPSREKIILENIEEFSTLSIHNISGTELVNQKIDTNRLEFIIPKDFHSGFYILSLSNKDYNYNVKLCIL